MSASGHRARRGGGHRARRRRRAARAAAAGQAVRRLLGISRRQARAGRDAARRARARARRGARHHGASRGALAHAANSSIRMRTSSSISSACSRGTASRTATTARRSRGRRPAASPWRRCCRPTRACSRRSRCPPSTASPAPRTSAKRRFLARARAALERGLRLIQVREKSWPRAAPRALRARACATLAAPYRRDAALQRRRGRRARAGSCRACTGRPRRCAVRNTRPRDLVVAASCHDARRARSAPPRSGSTSPCWVRCAPRPRIPTRAPLGLTGFAALVQGAQLPVYALGGLARADLDRLLDAGAHGIALRRGAWRDPDS